LKKQIEGGSGLSSSGGSGMPQRERLDTVQVS